MHVQYMRTIAVVLRVCLPSGYDFILTDREFGRVGHRQPTFNRTLHLHVWLFIRLLSLLTPGSVLLQCRIFCFFSSLNISSVLNFIDILSILSIMHTLTWNPVRIVRIILLVIFRSEWVSRYTQLIRRRLVPLFFRGHQNLSCGLRAFYWLCIHLNEIRLDAALRLQLRWKVDDVRLYHFVPWLLNLLVHMLSGGIYSFPWLWLRLWLRVLLCL